MPSTPTSVSPLTCAESLKLLADFWSLRIIEVLMQHEQRYCELQRAVGNVNPATLTKKLAELETAGIVARDAQAEGHAVVYRLTPLGEDTVPVLEAIRTFSRKMENRTKKKVAA